MVFNIQQFLSNPGESITELQNASRHVLSYLMTNWDIQFSSSMTKSQSLAKFKEYLVKNDLITEEFEGALGLG